MIVWIVSLFGWGVSFLVWGAKLYRLSKEGVVIPRWMFIIALGPAVLAGISIALLYDPVGLAPIARWMYALASIGFLLATLWKGKP